LAAKSSTALTRVSISDGVRLTGTGGVVWFIVCVANGYLGFDWTWNSGGTVPEATAAAMPSTWAIRAFCVAASITPPPNRAEIHVLVSATRVPICGAAAITSWIAETTEETTSIRFVGVT